MFDVLRVCYMRHVDVTCRGYIRLIHA